MSLKDTLRARAPHFALTAYREAVTWSALLRSPNKEFIRFSQPGHFYSPIPDLDAVRRHAGRVFDGDTDNVPGVDLNTAAQLDLVAEFAAVHAELPFPDHPTPGNRYHLDNEWFTYGDCVALYHMMRQFTPRRIVEIGSGFSSAAMLEIDERFLGGTTQLTFVEPYPERLNNLLTGTDDERCAVLVSGVQDVDLDVFRALEPGDFLFIDSSHVAKTDSDVVHLFFRVLPLLASGVFVHVHDIPWPFEYPRNWLEQGRAWNEAYFLRAFLQYNSAFEITYYAPYLAARHRAALAAALPTALKPPSIVTSPGNSSLWMRKR